MRPLFRALICLTLFTPSARAYEVPPSFADLVDRLSPAVVNISTTQKIKGDGQGLQMFDLPEGGENQEMPDDMRKFFEQFGRGQGGKEIEHEVISLGSGFIIDPEGYVATNSHVIANAEEVTVSLTDDTKLKARVIGRDAKTDIALLKVEAGHKLPFVTLGDSDAARVGDWVIAIGNPYNLGGTVTAGIISARARNINAGPFDDFIQTDAAINRGNSGGPMFNMKGEVIGINTAIFSPSSSGGSIGIGFAVPISMAKPVLAQLRSRGHIDRGWLGVKIQEVTDEIADSMGLKKAAGALVGEVTKDSPADKAGLKAGDLIIRFDGKDIKEMRNLPRLVADEPIGKTVPVTFLRNGQSRTVQVKLGELKDKDEENASGEDEDGGPAPVLKGSQVLGMTLNPITPEVREKYGITEGAKGVLITKVKETSEAAKRGLQPGDILTQVGDTAVDSPQGVSEAVAGAHNEGRKFVLLRIVHGSESLFITLPVEEKEKGKKKEKAE